jgi:hypothetical protein
LRFRSFWNLALSPFRLDTMASLYTPILSVRPALEQERTGAQIKSLARL